MKKAVLLLMVLWVAVLAACTNKEKEGTMVYQLEYQLPDSLRSYADYLPKQSTIYFKGDSVVSIHGTDAESTTMITHKPTDYLLCLLKSGFKRYQVLYTKEDQAHELPDMSKYEFIKGPATKKIANYNAQQYIVKDKFSGDTTSAWFTHDIAVPPSFLTTMFKPELGVPLLFSISQNGMVTKTTLKEIRFEPVPAGVFSAPADYKKLTPQQLNEMPVGD
ncbi:MAG: hypothetical protein V4592_20590 [Bacteroidota bacterium]